MAAVDFSNARLEFSTYGSVSWEYMSVYTTNTSDITITDSSGTSITSSKTLTKLEDTQNRFIVAFSGTFNASGTEFYINRSGIHWKISNVSFQSGDTFAFTMSFNLV